MITEPTVLILGAGGSMPYGFPSAGELRDLVIDTMADPGNVQRVQLAGSPNADYLQLFAIRLRQSLCASIDQFVATNEENFGGVAKAVIAAYLSKYEVDERARRAARHCKPDSDEARRRSGQWYDLLLNLLGRTFKEFAEAPLSIGTFNYDRSLEHFWINALTAREPTVKYSDAAAAVRDKITHLYGALGDYHGCGPLSRPFDDTSDLPRAAACIHLVRRGDVRPASFVEMEKRLFHARRVVFLGFSFDPLNIELLGSRQFWETLQHGRTIHGTCHGMRAVKRNAAAGLVNGITLFPFTILDYLEEIALP